MIALTIRSRTAANVSSGVGEKPGEKPGEDGMGEDELAVEFLKTRIKDTKRIISQLARIRAVKNTI